jgi:glutamine amidotransferase-like uncharacterized protein
MNPAAAHVYVFAVCVILVTCGCNMPGKVSVAIYVDEGTWDESVTACRAMVEWMGYSVSFIDANDINTKVLSDFKILCIPGGDMYQYAQDISPEGKEAVRQFIRSGGGYIGICGGAYFAAETVVWKGHQLSMESLRLFHGTARGPFNELVSHADYGMCEIGMVGAHPITESEFESAWILYYWGPAFFPDADAEIDILGRYSLQNYSAVLAFEYGAGRVFLIGTHPEIEEDSKRDNVTFGEELDDKGSDWDLMKKAVLWCLKEIA